MQQVLADYRTAPIDEKLRAMLGFLEKLTLTPQAVTKDDAAKVRALGVSRQAMEDAMLVCSLFNMIVRVADSTNFHVGSKADFEASADSLLRFGYKL
ncbi:MAG: hypothetical protein JNK82_14825 [Myxococcaceae bacterium]|nr:hypothetical protein [Myxococcaceae bacterium]